MDRQASREKPREANPEKSSSRPLLRTPPYWGRAWVVQEFSLARDLRVMFGSSAKMDFKTLRFHNEVGKGYHDSLDLSHRGTYARALTTPSTQSDVQMPTQYHMFRSSRSRLRFSRTGQRPGRLRNRSRLFYHN